MAMDIGALGTAYTAKTGKTLTAEQTDAIEKSAVGGFSDEELKDLAALGIDTDNLVEAFDDGAGLEDINKMGETTGKYDKTDKDGVIADLKAKFPVKGTLNGDPYSMGNPELNALNDMMDAGVIGDLIASGFSKADVADIVGSLFPNAGIRSQGQGYTAPYGHDEESRKIYDQFTKLVSQASAATTSPELEAIQAKIDANNTKINSNNLTIQANNNQIERLKGEIETVKQEIEADIDAAIKESEEIAEEQKEAVTNAVNKRLDEYASSNGTMSYEDFQNSLNGDLDTIEGSAEGKLSAAIGKMLEAEGRMSQLSDLVGRIGNLLAENDDLVSENTELKASNADYAKDLAAEQAKLLEEASNCVDDPDCQRCDPIGFEKDGARYDFFVDADGDGRLSNEKEFLGADNGWDAMLALDDGDGILTQEEIAKAGDSGLKMVKTNADGTQEIVNVTDVFDTADDSINLNSYKEVNKDVNKDVHLLGNFDVTFDADTTNEQIKGYNTLDTIGWLKDNYDFSDYNKGLYNIDADQDLKDQEAITKANFTADFNLDSIMDEMENKLAEGWNKLGLDRNDMAEHFEALTKESADAADSIKETFERKEAKAAAEEAAAKAAEEEAAEVAAEEQETVDVTDNADVDTTNLSEEEIEKLRRNGKQV